MSHPLLRLALVVCIASLPLAVAGCQGSPGAGPSMSDPGGGQGKSGEMASLNPEQFEGVESGVLLKPMGQLLAEAVIARRKAGGSLPDDYKSKEFVVSVIESLRLQHPGLFRVTRQQKKRYEAGDFNDQANLRRIREALAEFERHDLPMTTLTDYLAQQYHKGKLEGARLVIAARLLEAKANAALSGSGTMQKS